MKFSSMGPLLVLLSFGCGANVEAIEITTERSEESLEKESTPLLETEPGAQLSPTKDVVAVTESGQGEQEKKAEPDVIAIDQVPGELASNSDPEPITLNLVFDGLKTAKGQLCFLVFADPGSFPDQIENALVSQCHLLEDVTLQVTVKLPLSADTIAISSFHDENMDNELNTLGALGIPTESYGFSNNPPFSFGPPSFEQAAIAVDPGENEIAIQLTAIL
jgi:uncharacterized protein (DUF2141 family)